MTPARPRFLSRHWRSACLALLLAGVVIGAEDNSQSPVPEESSADAPPGAAEDEAVEGGTGDPEQSPAGEQPPPAAVPEKIVTQEGEVIDAEEVEEPDLAELPLSNAARVRLDSARDSVVLVRGFFGDAATSAFHGTGFAVGQDGLIITNYHVVSEAVLHPRRYRLEYVTADNRRGELRVYAVDVRNDLAVVKATEELGLPSLRMRTDVPRPGARAYSIGYPLNLGLTITEGVANGLVASGFDQRIHYTGAINSGMSGGPALDAGGTVYGVNVSVVTGRQLVGFVVPARHIVPLLRRAHGPLDESRSPLQLRAMVAQQAQAYESAVLEPWAAEVADRVSVTQSIFGYQLPTRMSPAFECSTTGSSEARRGLQTEIISCTGRTGVLLRLDLEVGNVTFQHRVLRSQGLHPAQFAQRVNDIAAAHQRQGSAQHVAPFACRNALVSLDGFDARISTCARQYRLFSGL
jgi:serine protease Do